MFTSFALWGETLATCCDFLLIYQKKAEDLGHPPLKFCVHWSYGLSEVKTSCQDGIDKLEERTSEENSHGDQNQASGRGQLTSHHSI